MADNQIIFNYFVWDIVSLNAIKLGFPHQFKLSSYSRPITAFGKAYIRTGDGDRVATKEQLKYFTVESQSEIDTHLLPSTYTIEDLDAESIKEYRKIIEEKGIINTNSQLSDQDFLYSIGVFRKDRLSNSNEYHLTDGGLLFFGKYISITDRFPRFQLDYQQYNSDNSTNWNDRVSAGDMNYPTLNIFSFYNLVLTKIEANVPDPFIQTLVERPITTI